MIPRNYKEYTKWKLQHGNLRSVHFSWKMVQIGDWIRDNIDWLESNNIIKFRIHGNREIHVFLDGKFFNVFVRHDTFSDKEFCIAWIKKNAKNIEHN